MSGRTPGDEKDPGAVEATLDDLPSVDTNPILKPVAATITLDEEPPPEPSATQLLDPIDDVPTDPKRKALRAPSPVLDVKADGSPTQRRKVAPLKFDAFESAPSLQAARREDGPRGAPAPWQKATVWTPGLIALTVVGVLVLLFVLLVVVRG